MLLNINVSEPTEDKRRAGWRASIFLAILTSVLHWNADTVTWFLEAVVGNEKWIHCAAFIGEGSLRYT